MKIGSRNDDLLPLICDITEIPERIFTHHFAIKKMLPELSIAQRMSWSAGRRTARVEDEAYCLLGIFDVSMPMLYGEGRKAFVRLQEEIIKTSTDHSIFAWRSNELGRNAQLLADSPNAFKIRQGDIIRHTDWHPVESYSMTNRGLTITLPIVVITYPGSMKSEYAAVLNCQEDGFFLALRLYAASEITASGLSAEYTVRSTRVVRLRPDETNAKKQTITILRSFSAVKESLQEPKAIKRVQSDWTHPNVGWWDNVCQDPKTSRAREVSTTPLPLSSLFAKYVRRNASRRSGEVRRVG